MALIDDVKQICDRLAPLGWRDLLIKVSANGLDIAQPTSTKLRAAVTSALPTIDNTLPGFEDYRAPRIAALAPANPRKVCSTTPWRARASCATAEGRAAWVCHDGRS